MLEVDITTKCFNTSKEKPIEVLKDLHFKCEPNSFTSIVGPSGCGKSTTLKCILGLDTDFDGTIRLQAEAQGVENGDSEQRISAVFQEPRLLPWRTVEQNIRLAAGLVDEDALTKLYATLGLSEHRHFYPAQLSLGLARRAAIARAFIVEPAVLILDEPFVSLDEMTATRLRKLLLDVWSARPCTALMVTHNLTEAIELSDRILFVSRSPSYVTKEVIVPVAREQRDRDTVAGILQDISHHVTGTEIDASS